MSFTCSACGSSSQGQIRPHKGPHSSLVGITRFADELINGAWILENLENKKLETKMYVIYMYYDENSELLAQNIKYEMIY